MKRFALLVAFLALGCFVVGCGPKEEKKPAPKDDKKVEKTDDAKGDGDPAPAPEKEEDKDPPKE